jgi:hypothetical protein
MDNHSISSSWVKIDAQDAVSVRSSGSSWVKIDAQDAVSARSSGSSVEGELRPEKDLIEQRNERLNR